MREIAQHAETGAAPLPAVVAPPCRASSSPRSLDGGSPAAGAHGAPADQPEHVTAEILVAATNANGDQIGPGCHPYEDPRFPPPAPAVHNGAWIDYATGDVHPWWEGWHSTSAGPSSPSTWLWIEVAS